MNELEYMIFLDSVSRQSGKTTALVKACLEIDGIFICHDELMAKKLKRNNPGLRTCTLKNDNELRGSRNSVIFDHHVVACASREALHELEQLRIEVNRLKRQLKDCSHDKDFIHDLVVMIKHCKSSLEDQNYGILKSGLQCLYDSIITRDDEAPAQYIRVKLV